MDFVHSSRHWPELGYDFPCPIHFTDEELQEHWRDADGWNEMQDFWKMAEAIVTPDGQTTPELYDTAIALFTEFREAALKTITTDEERRKFQAQMRWIEEIASQGRKGD